MPSGHPAVHPIHAPLAKVGSRWENEFHNWAQILGRAPDGRLYFLEERELIWANPSVSFPLPNNLTHALKYLRAVLASTSLAHWQNIKKKINFPAWGDDPIAYRLRSILEGD